MKRGFTLIELLVVIAIIGILAGVVMASLNSARAKSRDARRVSDLHEMRTALELYHTANGSYPVVSRWATSEVTDYDSGSGWAALQTALSPYMQRLPGDPSPSGTSGPWHHENYHYAYGSDGTVYDLVAQLEVNTSLMCSTKIWKYHHGEGSYPPDSPWCSSHGGGWSDRMYADH